MKRILTAALCGLMMTGAVKAESLKVDKDKSRIQVDGKATGHKFTGTLQDYRISVSGDLENLEPRSVSLSWKFSDLRTQDKKRDTKMLEWLGGGKPKGSFKFLKTWEKNGEKYAQGQITIHGVSRKINFPYTVKRDGSWITIDGTASLDYENFNLPIIRALALMKVNPNLSIRFHIVGKL